MSTEQIRNPNDRTPGPAFSGIWALSLFRTSDFGIRFCARSGAAGGLSEGARGFSRTGVSPVRAARQDFPRTGETPVLLAVVAFVALLAAGCRQSERPGPSSDASAAATSPQTIVTKTGVEMLLLPGGEFVMGDDEGEADEKPAHRVRLSPFCIDACEVTQAAYEGLMGKNPAKFTAADRPVERVSWLSAVQ